MRARAKSKPGESQGRKATGPRFLRDIHPKDPRIAGLPIFQANSMEELVMRKMLQFCLSLLLVSRVLILPASFAAEKSEVTGSEVFNPLPLDGFPAPQIGEFISMPTIKCPGHEPTGDPMQPCPVGSRTHLRDGVVDGRTISDDVRVTGWMTVVFIANVDPNFEGPAWGTFSIDVDDSEGIWEGTWQGLRVAEDGYWTAALSVQGKGFGGIVDGLKLMAEDQLLIVTPLPLAYIGTIEGRIIDPN